MKVTDKQMIEYAKGIKHGCAERGCKDCLFCGKNRCDINRGYILPKEWQIPPFKPTLSEDEKVILRSLDKEYKWISCDKNGSICISKDKPRKCIECWVDDDVECFICINGLFPNLFQWCKWEADEPWYIPDLLKEE